MTTSLPDLNTEDGRAAYRKELRQVGLPLRLAGLASIVLAALVVVAASRGMFGLPENVTYVGYALLAAGWVMVLVAIRLRTRHHKRRLAEGL